MLSDYLPRFRHGAFAVWRRNLLVWQRVLGPSLLVNFGEPLLYLVGLGYGLGHFVGAVMDLPYLAFLASGVLASSVMNTATFEAMYSVFTRMVPQRSYDAMLATPLAVPDILAGEILWCATKGAINGAAILLVAWGLGAASGPWLLLVLPVQLLIGFAFAGPALIMTAFARGYDFFNYYMTLGLTPMLLLSGVFYPIASLPPALQTAVQFLPLTHAVDLVRPLATGQLPQQVWLHVSVLLAYGVGGFGIALYFVRRRLLV